MLKGLHKPAAQEYKYDSVATWHAFLCIALLSRSSFLQATCAPLRRVSSLMAAAVAALSEKATGQLQASARVLCRLEIVGENGASLLMQSGHFKDSGTVTWQCISSI